MDFVPTAMLRVDALHPRDREVLPAGHRARRFEVLDAVCEDDRAALRVHWSATLGVPLLGKQAGDRLHAQFGVLLRLQDGLVREQHDYDCFLP